MTIEKVCANTVCPHHQLECEASTQVVRSNLPWAGSGMYIEIQRYEYFGKVFGTSFKLCSVCHHAVQLVKGGT